MKHRPYPLEWPMGQPRTATYLRKKSEFRILSFAKARDMLIAEVHRLCGYGSDDTLVISTDVPTRLDGLPYANMRAPDDSGVAIYFERKRKPYALACDAYRKVEENLRGLEHTIAAIRTIERHGGARMLEQALSGFTALPPSKEDASPRTPPGWSPSPGWWTILGFGCRVPLSVAEDRYRELAYDNHPDRGGSSETMLRINTAIEAARRDR